MSLNFIPAAVRSLKYLHAVAAEVMRLKPFIQLCRKLCRPPLSNPLPLLLLRFPKPRLGVAMSVETRQPKENKKIVQRRGDCNGSALIFRGSLF